MRHLLLIRHAVTEWNRSGRLLGHSDLPLSAEGEAQARALGARFAGEDVLVYTSPLKRAYQTAQIAFPRRELRQDARLKELNFGRFEGRTLEQNRALESWRTWYQDPFKRRAPNGESYEELRGRAVAWFEALPDAPCTVAVTHSGTIQMLLSYVLGVEHPRWRKRFGLHHAGVTWLRLSEDGVLIERVNDTRHLDALHLDSLPDPPDLDVARG